MEWNILGLSKKEEKVLLSIQGGENTPLLLSRATKISRTGIYAILQNLKKRGLAKTNIHNGKKYWSLVPVRELEEALYGAKKSLLKIPEGREEIHGLSDSMVVIHRGKEAVKSVLRKIFSEHRNERLYGFQGDTAANNWDNVFTVEETNTLNKLVKRNQFIVEAILPTGWFERETKKLGMSWAKEFEGRMTRTVTIDQSYFDHGAQLFIFKNSIYLIALSEEVIIEIRNSEIQKMLMSLFRFAEDHGTLIDPNSLLRKIIETK